MLARLEERIGHALPGEYRDHLLEQDGGQLEENDRGSVWFWDHEEADEGRPPAEEDLVELAESWVGFLAGLEPC
ncbi:SMI1/KNR4 family protein [Saccharothrix lopnurensis]|uniref:SMI1/KNR4 family protein n=1 Tax=Saccharothrix lopnurensis TaxID=1670621 RepID=A0ABW1P0F6_9PSEU